MSEAVKQLSFEEVQGQIENLKKIWDCTSFMAFRNYMVDLTNVSRLAFAQGPDSVRYLYDRMVMDIENKIQTAVSERNRRLYDRFEEVRLTGIPVVDDFRRMLEQHDYFFETKKERSAVTRGQREREIIEQYMAENPIVRPMWDRYVALKTQQCG